MISASPMKQQQSTSSQNITESVPVPSSEHVAEIVGRQGCKIKALRAKTNTYIKTPIRGEAPMFVITGRREDVMTAKREIQLAADHFSQIRARRGSGGSGQSGELVAASGDSKSPKLASASSASISPAEAASGILTAKPAQIQQQQPVVVSVLGRANSVSPGSSSLCLAPLSLNSELFSSHG